MSDTDPASTTSVDTSIPLLILVVSLLRCLQGQSTLRLDHFRDSRHLLRVISTPQNLVLALPSCTDPTDRERARMPALRLPPRQSQTSQLSIVTLRWPPANSRPPLTSCLRHRGRSLRANQWGPARPHRLRAGVCRRGSVERSDGLLPVTDPSSLARPRHTAGYFWTTACRPAHFGVGCD